ncbi:MAG: hypothetical protein WCX16_05555 [Candidatus Omnitrophota bacterium]
MAIGVLLEFSCRALAQENVDKGKVDMIQFLEAKDKAELEGLVVELIADALGVSMYDVLNNSAKGMAILKKIELKNNDELAISTLQSLSVVAEAFAADDQNKGKYPQGIEDLTKGKEPYASEQTCGQTVSGFTYDCIFSPEGYRFVAAPVTAGETGTGVFAITTGGVPEGFVIQEH